MIHKSGYFTYLAMVWSHCSWISEGPLYFDNSSHSMIIRSWFDQSEYCIWPLDRKYTTLHCLHVFSVPFRDYHTFCDDLCWGLVWRGKPCCVSNWYCSLVPRPHPIMRKRVWWSLSIFLVVPSQQSRLRISQRNSVMSQRSYHSLIQKSRLLTRHIEGSPQ